MEKTVREWFESINDEDVRRRALANMTFENMKCESMPDAIMNGIHWSEINEGALYWLEQYNKAERGEL